LLYGCFVLFVCLGFFNRLLEHKYVIIIGCSIVNIDKTSADKIAELIYPVGFYKRKADYIKRATRMLIEQHNSDVPKTLKELTNLPGVGPKMAHLCMTHAWNNSVGIAVDVHVHRITQRLGWVDNGSNSSTSTALSATRTPEHTRKELETFVPKEHWKDINTLLVGFGQQICKPIGPKCEQCKLQDYCEYYNSETIVNKKKSPIKNAKQKKAKKAKVKHEEEEEEEEEYETSEEEVVVPDREPVKKKQKSNGKQRTRQAKKKPSAKMKMSSSDDDDDEDYVSDQSMEEPMQPSIPDIENIIPPEQSPSKNTRSQTRQKQPQPPIRTSPKIVKKQ